MSKKRMKVRPSELRDPSAAPGPKNTGRAVKASDGGGVLEWLRTPTGLGIAVAALIVVVGLVYVLTNTASVNSLLGGGPTATPAAPVAANECDPVQAKGRALANVAAAQRNDYYQSAPPMTIDVNQKYQALICTSKGTIAVDLDAQNAPQTVNNFVFLARQGFYDGLNFHRVEKAPSFEIIQGGDPLGSGVGGSGYTVPAEIKLQHKEGALAMARQSDEVNPTRASSGSQFYIGIIPLPSLDAGGYTVFGYVSRGLDIAKQIAVGDLIVAIDIIEP